MLNLSLGFGSDRIHVNGRRGEQKQIQLLLKRKAFVKPVLLAYPKRDTIQSFIHRYIEEHPKYLELDFQDSQEQHIFWEIRDGQKIRDLQLLFEKEAIPQAIDVLEMSLGDYESESSLQYQLAAYCLASGNENKAIDHLDAALSLNTADYKKLFHYLPEAKNNTKVLGVIDTYRSTVENN